MIDTVATGRSPATGVSGGVHRRFRLFFPIVSGIVLAGLLIGFAPSFFLRGRIKVPFQLASLPPYLVIHGAVLTTWFVLMFVQSCLVSAHRTDLHRRLGIAAIGIASLVVPVSALL